MYMSEEVLHDEAPKYRQIANRLRAEIQAGIYPPGGKVPAEHVLCRRFAVSLPTVRSALKILTDEGIVRSRHGLGTFVLTPADRDADTDLRAGLVDDDEAKSMVGEGFHAALRKAADGDAAVRAYQAIDTMPDEEWDMVINFVVDGLATMGIRLIRVPVTTS